MMRKILVIDDDVHLSENISEILRQENYEVLNAFNGQSGIEMAMKEKPDLIICDVTMPVKNGFDVINEINAYPATRNIPFIFLTAISDLDGKLKGIECGATDYIFKPFDSGLLLTVISSRIKRNDSVLQQLDELSEEHIKSLEQILFITSHGIRKPVASFLGITHLIDQNKNSRMKREDLQKIISFLKPSVTEMDDFIRQLSNYVMEMRQREIWGKVKRA